ncbi:MAG: 16S rRNA (guanine(527)-N(7))-methyltransferase RsmG [Planctomycetia bacterium]
MSLHEALQQHEIHLPNDQVEQLDRYCQLLWDWNTKVNLTRHTDYEKFVSRDIVDSRVLADQLAEGERILDVGSGGGVPGIVLAILRPDLKVTMAESVGKKSKILIEIVKELGLPVHVFAGRAQDFLDSKKKGPRKNKNKTLDLKVVDTLTIRAVAAMPKLLRWFEPHWDRFGRMLLIKGPRWVEERGESRHFGLLSKLALRRLAAYPLPGTDSESTLLQITPKE